MSDLRTVAIEAVRGRVNLDDDETREIVDHVLDTILDLLAGLQGAITCPPEPMPYPTCDAAMVGRSFRLPNKGSTWSAIRSASQLLADITDDEIAATASIAEFGDDAIAVLSWIANESACVIERLRLRGASHDGA